MGLANIVPLVYLVERSRLCIDFSLTFFTIHLVLTWCHQRWPPTTLLWWLVVGVSGSVMALGGRAACLRRELLPIAIRNFMPSHPREQTARDLGTEEMELETRDARLAAPEVLFDSLQADGMPEEDAPSQLAKNARGSDEWGNDNWGEEDDGVTKPDNVPRAPNAPPGLASSQQHQQQQQPAISPAAPSSSSKPPPAPKGGKDD
ncbi:hypothetical protein GGI04_002848 [Coemansia thaxteri]|nr:hypothetical protein GGI04_002848 [Coemansia thaxteri]KAJ2467339.1 hypothetical protein GGI02_004067 [Coemansia sp. RSA 2322]